MIVRITYAIEPLVLRVAGALTVVKCWWWRRDKWLHQIGTCLLECGMVLGFIGLICLIYFAMRGLMG